MEKRIKWLRRVASVFDIVAILDTLAAAFLWAQFFSDLGRRTDTQLLSPMLSATALAFLLWTARLILYFLADLGEEILKVKWDVRDVRRKIVAAREEDETRQA